MMDGRISKSSMLSRLFMMAAVAASFMGFRHHLPNSVVAMEKVTVVVRVEFIAVRVAVTEPHSLLFLLLLLLLLSTMDTLPTNTNASEDTVGSMDQGTKPWGGG